MSPTPTTVSDLDAISAVLNTYLDSARSGRSDGMKEVFAEAATIYGYIGDQLAFNGPIQPMFDWTDGAGPSPQVQGRITHIDVVGQIASAKIETENWAGAKFSDFMLLLKVGGRWKIMNKVFHLH